MCDKHPCLPSLSRGLSPSVSIQGTVPFPSPPRALRTLRRVLEGNPCITGRSPPRSPPASLQMSIFALSALIAVRAHSPCLSARLSLFWGLSPSNSWEKTVPFNGSPLRGWNESKGTPAATSVEHRSVRRSHFALGRWFVDGVGPLGRWEVRRFDQGVPETPNDSTPNRPKSERLSARVGTDEVRTRTM